MTITQPGARPQTNRPEIAWTRDLEEWISSPAVADDEVMVITDSVGETTALDRATGEPLWHYRQSSGRAMAPILVPEGPVLTRSRERTTALDRESGQELWSHLTAPKVSAPILGDQGRLDPETGKTLWSAAANYGFVASGDKVLCFDSAGERSVEVGCHDIASGEKRWSFRDSGVSLIDHRSDRLTFMAQKYQDQGFTTALISRDEQSGRVLWHHQFEGSSLGPVETSPDGSKLVAIERLEDSSSSNLLVLDSRTGEPLWSVPSEAPARPPSERTANCF